MDGLFARYLLAAVAAGTTGMVLGIGMGITHDFRLAPVHVHLNLLGWVTFAIYGFAYRLLPDAAAMGLARTQFWLALSGLVVFCGGLAALRLDQPAGLPFAILGSFLTLGAMLCFGAVLLRCLGRSRIGTGRPAALGGVA